MSPLLLLATLIAGATEPDAALEARLADMAALEADHADDRDALVADPTVSDAALSDASGDWRLVTAARAVLAWRVDPELGHAVHRAVPRPTRAGTPRFGDPDTTSPEAMPFVVERLRHGDDGVDVRAALAGVLSAELPAGGAWVAGLFAEETEPEVRVALLSGLKRAPAEHALPTLAAGLADPSPEVREVAAALLAYRPDAGQLEGELSRALSDSHAPVRGFALRAIGWQEVTGARAAVPSLLADPDPEVRLHAVNTLVRLDPTGARSVLAPLAADPDARVVRAVERALR